MRTFYIGTFLMLLMLWGGDAWGQNCGTGLVLESVNNLGVNIIGDTGVDPTVNDCPNSTPCDISSLCSGESNLYRLSVEGASGVTITYSWGSGEINSTCSSPCTTSPLDFYKNGTTLRTITITATDASTCTNTYQIRVGASLASPEAPDITNNTSYGVTITGTPSGSFGEIYTFDADACNNSQLDLTAASASGCGSGCTYSWASTPSGTQSGTDNEDYNIASVGASNFVISVTSESSDGCLAESRIDITNNSLPVPDAGAVVEVCPSESLSLTATSTSGTSPYTFEWDNSISNGSPFTPPSTTTYNVTVTDAIGCTATDAVIVTVNSNPTISIGSADPTICQGLAVNQTASGGTSYFWSEGSTTATASLSPTATTSYTVTGTDANGCTSTATTDVTVNPVIALVSNVSVNGAASASGSAFTVCDDDEIEVTITGTGLASDGNYGDNNDWTWGGSGSGPNGSTTHTFTETMTTGATTTTYNYTLSYLNANGCTSTLPQLDITVNPNPLATISGSTVTVYCSATQLTLDALDGTSVSWPNTNVVQWEIDGVAVASSNSNGYTFNLNNSDNANTTYEYAVIIEVGGCQTRAITNVEVAPGITLSLPPNGTSCSGNDIQIPANASGGVPNYVYEWDGVTCSNGQTASTCQLNNPADGTYNFSVTVTDNSGGSCPAIGTQTTTVQSCGTVSIGLQVNNSAPLNVSNRVCLGDNISLTANCSTCNSGGQPLIFAWSIGGSSQNISFTINQNYPDTFPVSLNIGYNELNTDGSSTYKQIGNSEIILYLSVPSLIIPNDTSICDGGGFDLTAECPDCTANLAYNWVELNTLTPGNISGITTTANTTLVSNPTLTNSVIYSVEVTDVYGCKDRDTVSVSFIPLPGTTIDQGTDAQFCPTASVLLSTSTVNCNNCNYQWTTGQISSSISVNVDDTYSVTTTNNGCSDVASITVTKYPLSEPEIVGPNGSLTNPPPNNVAYLCGTGPIWLAVDSITCIGCSYAWNIGSSDDTITVNFQGGYFVQVIDTNGCIGYSDPVFVIESLEGQGNLASAIPENICNGDSTILTIEPCVNCNYQWYNNASPTIPLVGADTSRFSTTIRGTYFAAITNENGCIYNSNLVTIDTVTVDIPSIFSSTDTVCNTTGGAASYVTLSTTPEPSYLSYQWYMGTPLAPISGATNSNFTTTVPGVYAVAVTYDNGCVKMSPIKTIVSANFSVTITNPSPANVVICEGSTVSLNTPSNIGYTYQWYRNGAVILGANASEYLADSSGFYNVYVTNDWGCSRLSTSITLTESSNTINSNAFPNYVEICPGDSATLQVSLCSNCQYQWFNAATGLSIPATPTDSSAYFRVTVFTGGSYYALVKDDFCESISDTIQVVSLPVITPSINTNASIVCTGVTPEITTQGCVGCTYTWIRDSSIVFGALNDTFLIVSNVSDAGNYSLEVTYPNGCVGVSNNIPISDGSYNLTIAVADSIICNNDDELISSAASAPAICNLGCTYQWFRTSIAIPSSNLPNYTANTGGNYKLKMTDSRGCIEESNIIPLTEVNLLPNITSTSTDICGDQAVYFYYPDSANCIGCTYEWQKGGGTATYGVINQPWYMSDTGVNAVGFYSLDVTLNGCVAPSNQITLNQVGALDISIAATDSNICNNDTTTLYRIGGGCANCQFQWLLGGVPILSATTPSLTVSNPGDYSLEMTLGTNGCKDTSNVKVLLPVDSPIDSFSLTAAGLTPLTNTGPAIDLHGAVYPNIIAINSVNDTFYSQPFNAALGANSGLSGVYNEILTPNDAGSGFHRVYYKFDTLGCSFLYDDILFVFGEPNISFVNENPAAPLYEACVADTFQLQVFNMPFLIDSVYLFNENNVYVSVPIESSTLQDTIFGLDTVWNGTIRLGIPDDAYASFMMVTSAGNVDTFITPFILIHNSNLDISGLPGVVCSSGSPLPLTGTPAGGFFTAEYYSGGTLPTGSLVAGAFSGNNFNTSAMTRASYGNDMVQNMRVVYNFQNSYTNGISCPQVDTISQFIEARAVFLDSVKYNPISVSQDRELLSNLVFRVYPYQSQPSWIRDSIGGSISFSGNFTFPAGSPLDFLPANAGVGKHAMTYSIHNGVCINQVTDSIRVIDAPLAIGIPDSMCRTQTFANFGRESGLYSYFDGPNIAIQPGIFMSDTINIINIYSTTGPNEGLTVVNSALNLEEYNYNPGPVTGNYDTLKVEYWYKKVEYIAGVPVDTVMYIVGSIVTPIYIEDTFAVDIIDNIVANVYCEEDQLYLLAGSPSGGIFSLQGGTAAYATDSVLINNILNPFDVHSPENSNTTYTLTYVKQGAICQNSDTKTITIPEPLDPAFATSSGKRTFCQTDPSENIVINTVGNFTGAWLINGITQPAFIFNPNLLNPGNQIVSHIVTDNTFGCIYEAVDSYFINPLPILAVNPPLDTAYCTNDPVDTIRVSPNPICDQFVTGGFTMLFQGFDSLAFPWVTENTGTGNNWVRSTVLPYAGTGAAFVNTSNDVEDAWMFTPNLNLTTGHTYLVTLFASAGTCSPPPCLPASFRLRVGQGQTIAAQSAGTVFGDTTIDHTFYQPYTFSYTHTGLSGNYNFSFQCFSGVDARSLTFDDIAIIDGSVSGCVLGGTGTMVGPGINYVSDSTYAFDPTIVTPGTYDIRYVYTAAATGCTDSIVMPVRVKPHPLPTFTDLDPQYCDNESPVLLTGTPSGGTFSSNGPNLFNTPFWAFDPNQGFLNEIVAYTYTDLATMCTTTVYDTTTVVSITDSVTISTVDPSGYCYNVDSVLLNVSSVFGDPDTVLTGYFYGLGVRNGENGPGLTNFYPDSAVIDGNRYGDFLVTYVYPTMSGCFDTTSTIVTVHAIPDLSFDFMVPDSLRLPDSVCYNAGILPIVVNNHAITGNLGEIEYDSLLPVGPFLGGTYTPSLGVLDTLNPVNFGIGWHNISFTYTDANGCISTISDSFRVDTVPVIRFAGLQLDRIYCENDPPSLLLAYPPYYPGSGYLQLTSGLDTIIVDSSFYLIDPTQFVDTAIDDRRWNIFYTFEDLNFCSSSSTDSFFVRPYPRLGMSLPPTFCSAPVLEPLMQYVDSIPGGTFTDNLVVTGIVQDTLLNLSGTMGPRRITYYYVDSVSTCWNSIYQDVTIYNTPDFDFYALGGCEGATITFVSDTAITNLSPGLDSITQIEWIYGDGNNDFVTPSIATEIPDQTHVYNNQGVYLVNLAVTNQGQCTDTISRQLVISPFVNSYPYVEDFQTGTGNWYQEEPIIVPDTAAIWKHSELLGNVINNPGNFAWVTKANAPYTYNENERAWVYSPCFDFSNSWRPMIVMDIWRDFLTDIDGTVLEFYDDNDNQWKPVGETENGINWYQTDFLVSRPGNQPNVTYPKGWSGESNGWEKARYRLDNLAGRPFVRFRVAFASDPNTVLEGHEGMAFDSVWIGERGRNVLVEHFSNYFYVNQQGTIMDVIDQRVYDSIYSNLNGRDVALIQYQTNIQQVDPLNAIFNNDFDSRVLFYGINDNAQVRIDGQAYGNGKSDSLSQWQLEYDMLQFPVFDIQLDPLVFAGNTIQLNATAIALSDIDSASYSMTFAITEDNIYNNRGFPMQSVLRKFLPDPSGYPLLRGFTQGDTESRGVSWTYNFGTLNPANIEAVVYIQNNDTKDVLQVATTRDLSIFPPVGTVSFEEETASRMDIDGMNLFPNPADTYFNVSFDNPLNDDYNWQLVDVLGRVIQTGKAVKGANQLRVESYRLSEGTYFFTIQNDKAYAQRKVIITHRP